jgi:hypothetical protein
MSRMWQRYPVRSGLFGVAVLAVLCLPSCGKSEFQTVYPVSGKILVNGQPAEDCLVYLNRTFDDHHPRLVRPFGVCDANGDFKISSYFTHDGAPEGEYVVTVEWRERSGLLKNNLDGMDRLDGAYEKVDTTRTLPGFVVKVGREPLVLPPFELTQSEAAKKKHEAWKKRPQVGLGGEN